jgi:hypothetical protein
MSHRRLGARLRTASLAAIVAGSFGVTGVATVVVPGVANAAIPAAPPGFTLTWSDDFGAANGSSVSLRAHANGEYVTAENAGASALIANRAAIGAWEEFDQIAS